MERDVPPWSSFLSLWKPPKKLEILLRLAPQPQAISAPTLLLQPHPSYCIVGISLPSCASVSAMVTPYHSSPMPSIIIALCISPFVTWDMTIPPRLTASNKWLYQMAKPLLCLYTSTMVPSTLTSSPLLMNRLLCCPSPPCMQTRMFSQPSL